MSRAGTALAAAILATTGAVGASCVEILGLGYTDAPLELCAMLDRCYAENPYGDCPSRVETSLTQAGARQRDDYLRFFAGSSCLSTCTDARDCLDHPALCSPPEESCTGIEECCGFTAGIAVCESRCCNKRGAPCVDARDCCGSQGCSPSPSGGNSCGGVELCRFEGDSCDTDEQCCTEVCLSSGACGPLCKIDGSCNEDKECCGKSCFEGQCQAPPSCSQLGESCAAIPCCDPEATTCYQGECLAACFADAADCSSNTQCCSGWCEPTTFECGPESCLPIEVPCDPSSSAEFECCEGLTCTDAHLCLPVPG